MSQMRSPQPPDAQKRFLLHQQFLREIQIRFADLANPQSWLTRMLYQFLLEAIQIQLAEPLVSSAFQGFVRGILCSRGLDVSETEAVINEVFLRALRQLQAGCVVRNPGAWLRRIALNVVREVTRQQRRSISWDCREFLEDRYLQPDSPEAHPVALGEGFAAWDGAHSCPSDSFSDSFGEYSSHYHHLRIIWQQLTTLDRRMLVLRVLESYAWVQVQTTLQQEFSETISVTALRKRYQRILLKLRKQLETLEGDVA